MKTILAITRKELEQYFASPIAYIVVALLMIILGIFFYIYLTLYMQQVAASAQYGGEGADLSQSIMRPFFANAAFFFLIIFPMLTMKLFAEEKKLGTYELLMTSPISISQLVVGKYFGVLTLMLTIIVLLLIYPATLFVFGGRPDIGPILTGFLGLFLLGAAFVAIGLFTSSVTDSQIVAAVLCFVFLILFWIINWISRSEAWYGKVLQYISIYQRFDDFTKGILNLNDVFYYVSFAFVGLFITGIVLQSQRWKS
ncbi:ABC transporter permease [bacterium]|nr:ABC transporter permease [bacterium]